MNEENDINKQNDVSNSQEIVSEDIIAQQPLMAALQQPDPVPVVEPPKEEPVKPEPAPEPVPIETLEPLETLSPTTDPVEQNSVPVPSEVLGEIKKPVKNEVQKKPVWPIILLILAIVGYYGLKFYIKEMAKNDKTHTFKIEKITNCNEAKDFYKNNYNIEFAILGNKASVDYFLLGPSGSHFDLKIACSGEDIIKDVHITEYNNNYDKLLEYYKPYATTPDDYTYFSNWLLYFRKNGALKLYEPFSDTIEVKETEKGTELDIEILNTNSKVALKDFGIRYENNELVFSNEKNNINIKKPSSIDNQVLNSTLVKQEGKTAVITFTYGDYVLSYDIKQLSMSTIEGLANPYELNKIKIGDKEYYYVNMDDLYMGFIPYESSDFNNDDQLGARITLFVKNNTNGHAVSANTWNEVFKSIVE